MASLIDELITTLEQEDKQYQELFKVANEKTPVIVKGNTEELARITTVEESYVETITRLERKRSETVKDIAIVLNKKESELTIKNLLVILEGQPEESTRLAKVHDSLKKTLAAISRVNEMNQNLIKSSLEMIEFSINMYKNLYQMPETGNYNKSAYNTDTPGNSGGVFDAKN